MPDVIDKVMSLLNRDGEGESEKDLLLKQVAKDISQNKYSKFYRVRQQEADASLGQLFFNLYKLIYPLQIFLRDPAKEARIRQITLEAFLDKKTMDLIKRLNRESINERARTVGGDIIKMLQDDLAALTAGFDSPRIAAADKCYNLIASMKRFVFYDFSSIIRKFDAEFKEGDFLTQMKFVPVDVSVLAADLSSFLSVLPFVGIDDDWKTVFEIIKYCKGGTEVVPLAQWNNILVNLADIKKSRILELISRMATGNPVLEIKPNIPHEALSAAWLENKTGEIREMINNINESQRIAQINSLEQSIFAPLTVVRLNYYIPERGKVLLEKGLESYDYALALNHLITYIQEFLGKEIQELCDILLVRGQWTNNAASRTMSSAFHEVLDVAEEILKLDENLSDEGSNGIRLKGAMLRVDRDKTQGRYINSIINGVNEEAYDIINKAVPALIVVGKHFKMLLDDCEKKPFELIMNWKELNSVTKVPMAQRIAAAYKKLNLFVQLMTMEKSSLEEE